MHRPGIRRKATALTAAALSAGLLLASCSGNEPADGPETSGETTEQKPANIIPVSLNGFEQPEQKFTSMAAEGCSAEFQDWAKDAIVFFTAVNGGNAEYVDVSFSPGAPSKNGHKTCEISIKDAQITDTPGGDINDATLLIEGLPRTLNPANGEKLTAFNANRQPGGYEVTNLSEIEGISPLIDDAIAYADVNKLEIDTITFNGERSTDNTRGTLSNENTVLSLMFNTFRTEEGSDARPYRGAWVAASSDDPQKETSEPGSTAIGQLSYILTLAMHNHFTGSSETMFKIVS